MNCYLKSYNYVRAKLFGKKLTTITVIISQRSRPHSHNEEKYSERYEGYSFSATKADDANGCRFKFINYTHDIERWDTVIVPMTDEQEDTSWAEACRMADLPIDWLTHKKDYWHEGDIYYGENHIKYDTLGQICHIFPWKILPPSKVKTWCTKAVNDSIDAGRLDFKEVLEKYIDTTEIKPDQLDTMARYYFLENGK